ncbi:hypothetical protein [Inmirania thermothiophila]|uniref:hypothetical protein n=1 Tax=Inmirania thermothiophila TaxID=1750597 RepID=UPI001FEA2D7C|nr:hypothetical protein [Inmirania thermothiophila]
MASEGGFRRTALGWLGDGLAHEIEEIARGIEAALAAEEPVQVAEALAQRLHGVVGTLRLVELDGAVALGEELEQVLQGLPRRPTEAQRDVAELLVRGLLRLRALLDRARSGDSEPPAALVRTINDLRAARGAEPLPLESFFRPDLTRPVPAEALPPHREGDAGAVALRARPVVQRALLGWMRGGDGNALRAFVGALDQVLARVAAPPLQLLLAAIAAVAEGAATGALAGDEPAARLLGNADRCLRDLTRRPEPEVAAAVPEGVLRRLLYAVARARPATPRIRALQSAYDLTALVGSEEPAAELNLELLERVAEGLREELAVARDLLDAAGGDDAEARIAEAAQAMGRIADILRVVGLEEGVARLEAAVARLGDTGSAPQADGEAMMLAATALVEVEALLDSMAHGRERPAGGAVGEARRHVLEEVLQELALARDALTALLSRPQEGALVDAAGRHFGQAALLLRVLDLEQGAQAVEAVAAAVAAGFLGALRGGREAELERLAEGVTALELYAEGLRDGRSDADELLARAHAVLGAPGPEAAEPEAAEAEVAEAEVAEPEVAEPEVAEPEVAEPEVAEPEVAEPEVAEPEGRGGRARGGRARGGRARGGRARGGRARGGRARGGRSRGGRARGGRARGGRSRGGRSRGGRARDGRARDGGPRAVAPGRAGGPRGRCGPRDRRDLRGGGRRGPGRGARGACTAAAR